MLSKEVLKDLYVEKRLSSLKIAEMHGMKHSKTVRRWLKKQDIPRRSLSEAGTVKIKKPFDGDLRLRAYMLGLRAGDFHAKRMRLFIRIQTTTTHPAQIELMRRSFSKYGKVCIYEFYNKGFKCRQWFIYCDVDKSFSFLLDKPQEIPEWIFTDDELFFHFVSGYSDSEGCWRIFKSHETHTRYAYQLSSQDKTILKQIVVKFNQLGLATNIYLDHKGGTIKHGVKANKDVYRIVIYQKRAVLRLAKILLPLSNHQEKIDKINLLLVSYSKKWVDVEGAVLELRNQIKKSRL